MRRALATGGWLAMLALALPPAFAAGAPPISGRTLVEESLSRHAAPPFTYEELTMVLNDAAGLRRVRTALQYQRSDADGSVQRVLVFQSPADLRGTTLRLSARAGQPASRSLYLPALGREIPYGTDLSDRVAGSDFSLADLEGERPQDFDYERERDRDLERVPHYAVRARPRYEAVARATGYAERRLFLRKDSLFISRIEYFDRRGTLVRQLSFRDPRADGEGALRPGMILMEDLRERHSTLLKVERRVHSPDYVPATLFAGSAP